MRQRAWPKDKIYVLITLLAGMLAFYACNDNSSNATAEPVITSINPTVGMPGDTVTINGSGFSEEALVTFNETRADIIFILETTVKAIVPRLINSGPVPVAMMVDDNNIAGPDFTVQEISKKIIFSSNRSDIWDIWMMDANGVNPRNLTNDPNSFAFGPRLSPDGTKIVFEKRIPGENDIWVMDANGANQMNLTNKPATNDLNPQWSPDGRKILFREGPPIESDIWMMDSDGSNQINLSNNSVQEALPHWSPDGTRIAFVRGSDIWVMNTDGTDRINLTNNDNNDILTESTTPSWSPDGTQLSFVSRNASNITNWEIFVIDVDGTNPANLTKNTRWDHEAQWFTG